MCTVLSDVDMGADHTAEEPASQPRLQIVVREVDCLVGGSALQRPLLCVCVCVCVCRFD